MNTNKYIKLNDPFILHRWHLSHVFFYAKCFDMQYYAQFLYFSRSLMDQRENALLI